MKRGHFNRTTLVGSVERTLSASFTIKLSNPRFRNVATSQSASAVDLLTFFRLWLVAILGESDLAHLDRETSTVDAFDPDEQLCSIKGATFDLAEPNRPKDAEALVCVRKPKEDATRRVDPIGGEVHE
ncbi:predicted protein [Lichtheimia corymbifera JMRC:FSU:9682]|uniref:Uncharacterized protein n=1 Tax=Lichtheimia corymbifera JMRC:FSU:9682 TaxID=1263082 RepID=A0A068RTE7_9FUNG|nr:predicted protein [Lichtheimia corymbifera JMRC:FSU:9682]